MVALSFINRLQSTLAYDARGSAFFVRQTTRTAQMTSTLPSKFESVVAGQSCSEVQQLLGEPSLAEDTTIPAGSAWGLQESLTYKISAGAPVRQWIYECDASDYTIWFASVDGDWRVTLRLRLPTILRKR
jgi:hypothetical protein